MSANKVFTLLKTGDIHCIPIQVCNELVNGEGSLLNQVKVTVNLPNGVAFDDATATQGAYDSVADVWDVGTLIPGQTATLNLCVQILDDCESPFAITYDVKAISASCNCEVTTEDNQGCTTLDGVSCCDLCGCINLVSPNETVQIVKGDACTWEFESQDTRLEPYIDGDELCFDLIDAHTGTVLQPKVQCINIFEIEIATVGFDPATQLITITETNGDVYTVDLSSLVDMYGLTVEGTDCLDITLTGSGSLADPWVISAEPIISPDDKNIIECRANGLYAAAPIGPVAEIPLGDIDPTTIDCSQYTVGQYLNVTDAVGNVERFQVVWSDVTCTACALQSLCCTSIPEPMCSVSGVLELTCDASGNATGTLTITSTDASGSYNLTWTGATGGIITATDGANAISLSGLVDGINPISVTITDSVDTACTSTTSVDVTCSITGPTCALTTSNLILTCVDGVIAGTYTAASTGTVGTLTATLTGAPTGVTLSTTPTIGANTITSTGTAADGTYTIGLVVSSDDPACSSTQLTQDVTCESVQVCGEPVIIICEPFYDSSDPTQVVSSDKACGSIEKVYKVLDGTNVYYFKDAADACAYIDAGGTGVPTQTSYVDATEFFIDDGSDAQNMTSAGTPGSILPELPCGPDPASPLCWNYYSGGGALEHLVITDGTSSIFHTTNTTNGGFPIPIPYVIENEYANPNGLQHQTYQAGEFPEIGWVGSNSCEYMFTYSFDPASGTVLLESRYGSHNCCPNTVGQCYDMTDVVFPISTEFTFLGRNGQGRYPNSFQDKHGVFYCPDCDGDLCSEDASGVSIASSTIGATGEFEQFGPDAGVVYKITGTTPATIGTPFSIDVEVTCPCGPTLTFVIKGTT